MKNYLHLASNGLGFNESGVRFYADKFGGQVSRIDVFYFWTDESGGLYPGCFRSFYCLKTPIL